MGIAEVIAGLAAWVATMPMPAPVQQQAAATPYAQCDAAITAAAKLQRHLPDKLLPAIARVESGRLDPASGRVRAWPWTINVEGTGYFFETKAEVIAAVQALQAKGKRSIDVGCMQVNLMHHPNAFATLDAAFDPPTNAGYAVKFLTGLYAQTKDWPLATAYYHSTTPEFGEQYQRLVFGRVITPMGAASPDKPAGPESAWPSQTQRFGAIPPPSLAYRAFAPARPAAMFGNMPLMTFGVVAPPPKPAGRR